MRCGGWIHHRRRYIRSRGGAARVDQLKTGPISTLFDPDGFQFRELPIVIVDLAFDFLRDNHVAPPHATNHLLEHIWSLRSICAPFARLTLLSVVSYCHPLTCILLKIRLTDNSVTYANTHCFHCGNTYFISRPGRLHDVARFASSQLRRRLGEHRRWSQNGHNKSATLTG